MAIEALTYLAIEAPVVVSALEGAAAYCPFIVLLPLLSFVIISFVSQKKGTVSAAVAIGSLLLSFLLSVLMLVPRLGESQPTYEWQYSWLTVGYSELFQSSIKIGLLVDNLSALTSVMVTFVASLVAIYSYGYMKKEIGHFPTQNSASLSRFFGYLSLFVFSMLGLVFSNNLLQVYIFWELVGVCSYFLIGFWYFKKSAADANKKSFVVTKFADLFFLIGILAVGLGAGTFNLLELDQVTDLSFSLMGSLALPLILITFGPIGKSAQFPLHIWLPDAMEGPTPVSALIHAATMVAAGIYLVGRLFGLYQQVPAAAYFVAVVGAITALMAALIAVVQNDIKKVLAYSTISQLGFMLTALGSGVYAAGLFHLFTHAFFKALLFLGAGAVIVACHNNDMWKMGGLKKHLPHTHVAFAIGCLALAGVPPFAGFWSKDEILGGVYQQNSELFVILAMAAFLTAFYVTRMYCLTFMGGYRTKHAAGHYQGVVPSPDLPAPMAPSRDTLGMEPDWNEDKATPGKDPDICLGHKQEQVPHHSGPPHEVSPVMYLPLCVLAFFAATLGFAGTPWANHFHHFINHAREAPHEFSGALMIASIVIALGGIGVGWNLYAKDPVAGEEKLRNSLGGFHTVLCQKFYLDHFWAWAVSKTMMLWSIAAAWFDDDIIDGGVRGSGLLTALLGEKLRKEHSGLVSHYLFMLIASLLLLAALLASIQPEFVLSPSRLLDFRDSIPSGGLLP